MQKHFLYTFLLCCFISSSFTTTWGFFGHRKINRMAVFTLPQELIPIYKKHIEFVTEHAIDPDKRRYATKREAPRHYIDIDHWGKMPFENVPRDFEDALVDYCEIRCTGVDGNVRSLFGHKIAYDSNDYISIGTQKIPKTEYRKAMKSYIADAYFEDYWLMSCESLDSVLGIKVPDCIQIEIVDSLSEYGIVPYYLLTMKKRLDLAFQQKDASRILQLSADIGHYIGDAHVPLHTAKNYNGQLTGQDGIHAFWESRIPELFAEERFDFFVGGAEYINNPKEFFWDIVLDSHVLLDSVLLIEKRLSQEFPQDQQYCYEERLDRTVRTQCKAYADAYDLAMKGMVEERMRDAILAIGSIWYTSWVDSGQPNVYDLIDFELSEADRKKFEVENNLYKEGSIHGRKHDN